MDPLCEKYYNISPYAYCAGNPVMIVDPDGRHLEVSRYKNKFGMYEVVGGEADDDLNIYLDYGTENQTIIGRALTENGEITHEGLPTTKAHWKGFEIGHETPEGRFIREAIKIFFFNSSRFAW